MKLQILVPQYTETDEVVKPLLDSIAIQQSVDLANDVGVIIVNDGSGVYLSEELLTGYPFKIEYYKNEHKGVSATRNACLDHAEAEYVMFCDCDDMFFNACGLWIIFREMKKGFNTMVSMFVEEQKNRETGEMFYINHERDTVFVHGKVHRRQYLIDQNIRWNDNLTIHEDSYFNILCQSLSEHVIYGESPFYLWKWRDASVCRHDPKYILKTYNNLIDSQDALIQEFERRGKPELAENFVGSMVFDAYYTMNKPEWIDQENKAYRNAVEERFKDFFKLHKAEWDGIKSDKRMRISNAVRMRSVSEGMQMEQITIDDWLKQITKRKRRSAK